ncbi:MAG TPA: DUF423 domain-containing protein [Gemmatimonadales bacterium]|jgi:uncharacterized membrane protein YgdD (TMEM256/DUF423 family)|nr:DUF423 domain-containing protein [Gemmatimonadales bacterium]
MDRPLGTLGALLGGLAVAAGAFGVHGLRGRLSPELLPVFETGARYQMYHALALLAVAVLLERRPSSVLRSAGWCFFGGTLVFSGSLYLLALTGATWWGAVTPLGGVALLSGWGMLAWGLWRR